MIIIETKVLKIYNCLWIQIQVQDAFSYYILDTVHYKKAH